jgi:hypothetical protein
MWKWKEVPASASVFLLHSRLNGTCRCSEPFSLPAAGTLARISPYELQRNSRKKARKAKLIKRAACNNLIG